MTDLRVEFCGETHELDPSTPFVVGRDGQLVVDDNPYLHRRFLELSHHDGWWWLANIGNRLAATVAEAGGGVVAFLGPGARLPVVFARTAVRFTAGATGYELELVADAAPYLPVRHDHLGGDAATTVGGVELRGEQRLLVVALAEPVLRRETGHVSVMPTSAEVARRLGWSLTKLNRKLDAVCHKLERAGVRGLHGRPGELASNRRAQLVEYAVAARLVTMADLSMLDEVVAS